VRTPTGGYVEDSAKTLTGTAHAERSLPLILRPPFQACLRQGRRPRLKI